MRNPARDYADEALREWGEHVRAMREINGYPPMSPEARMRDAGTVAPPGPRIPPLPGALRGRTDPRVRRVQAIVEELSSSAYDRRLAQVADVLRVHYASGLRGSDRLREARIRSERQYRDLWGWGRSIVAHQLRTREA